MSFPWESDELFTEKSPRSVASEGTVVVLPIKAGCEARDWAQPAELEKLQRTLASTILFLETVSTILVRWTVDGDVGLHDFLLERTTSSVRSPPHSSGHGSGQHLAALQHAASDRPVDGRAEGELDGEATQQWQMVQVSAKLTVTPKTPLLVDQGARRHSEEGDAQERARAPHVRLAARRRTSGRLRKT